MDLFIDQDDPSGLIEQVYRQLRDVIESGRLASGDRLPPTRVLAADLGVSRFTVAEAYSRLTAAGMTTARTSDGTRVAAGPPLSDRSADDTGLTITAGALQLRRFDTNPLERPRFDLRPGATDPDLFPNRPWRQCVRRAVTSPPGHYGDPAGSEQLRRSIARWVARSRGVVATPEQVVVTAGAQHAFDLLVRVLVDAGGTVAVEEPGYPPIVGLSRALGCNVVGVPVDAQGIVVDAIPDQARLAYVTPSHQYPLGAVMSRTRRIELLDWARRHGAAVIEDDYDTQFVHDHRPLEPLHRLDTGGHVVYVGTYSKILAPSLRVGFAVAPLPVVEAMGTLRQHIDWCPPSIIDTALAQFIDAGHLDRHVRRASRVYVERRRLLIAEMTSAFAGRAEIIPSSAGLHIAVLHGGDADDEALARSLSEHDVMVGSLQRTYHFSRPPGGFVVGFGAIATADVPAAVGALNRVVDAIVGRP